MINWINNWIKRLQFGKPHLETADYQDREHGFPYGSLINWRN